jgi:hypothetical protein
MFECPDFYPVQATGGRVMHVAKISDAGDWYTLGSYDESTQSFVTTMHLQPYFAGTFYASKRFFDEVNSRQVLFGWSKEEDNGAPRGWQGIQTLPAVVTVDDDLPALRVYPIPELEGLRNQTQLVLRNKALAPNTDVPVDASGLMLELQALFQLESSSQLRAQGFEHLALWRECVEARWTYAGPAGCGLDEARSEYVSGGDPADGGSFGVGVRSSADGSTQTRVGAQMVLSTGPMHGMDRPGGDYRDFGFPQGSNDTDNMLNCSSTCSAEPQCVAWTYVASGAPPNPSYPTPRCSLKSSLPALDSNQWCTSGTPSSLVLATNRTRAGGDGPQDVVSTPVPVKPGDTTVSLSVWVDHSAVESFAQLGLARMITRQYPNASSDGVRLFTQGPKPAEAQLTVYSIDSVWIPNPWNV